MTRLVLEPGNPYDFTQGELGALAEALREEDTTLDVVTIHRPEEGYGVTLTEVLHIFVEHKDEVVLGTRAGVKLMQIMRDRWKRDGRERVVIVYGPDGEPLREVRIAGPDGDAVDADPPTEPREPPV